LSILYHKIFNKNQQIMIFRQNQKIILEINVDTVTNYKSPLAIKIDEYELYELMENMIKLLPELKKKALKSILL